MDERVLQKIGLTKVEAKVYIALLDLNEAMAGEISQFSGVHRRSVYEAVKSLEKKGLVKSEVIGKRRYFHVEEPEKLVQMIDKKEKELMKVIPTLGADYEFSKDTQITNFFRGRGGLKTIFDDMIIKGKEINIIGEVYVEGYEEEFERFEQRRKEEKIHLRRIVTEDWRGEVQETYNRSVKYLPKKYSINTSLAVYANKVAIMQWGEDVLVVSIKVDAITENLREYFEFLWSIAKK